MMDFIRDMIDQWFTFVGLACAWLVLDGSAKTITGYIIMFSAAFWAVTYPIRNPKDEEDAE